MILPTPRAVILFALSIPVALLVVSGYPGGWYYALYLPLVVLALIIADATMLLPGRRLLISRLNRPSRLYVGQAGTINFQLSDENYKRRLLVTGILQQSGPAEPARIASGLMRAGRLDMSLVIVPLRRGQITVEALWLRWRGPMQLVEARRRQPLGEKIDVVPDVHRLYEIALQFFARDAVFGIKTQRRQGDGTEFDNLCEYMPGMDNRFIDWKRSARHRMLLCKEFRQERNHQIVFGFDTGHLMLEPVNGIPKLDHAIKAGLLLGWVCLHSGDLVGGCGFDVRFRNFIKPGRGMPYFTRFQRFTAGLDYHTEESNFTLGLAELGSRLQRRALIILFTEFVDSISAELLIESLQLLSRKHLVVFVTLRDPGLTRLQEAPPHEFTRVAQAVIAADFLRERSIVLERVARLGIHCLDTSVENLSPALLNRYLMIKQRGLL